DTAKTPRATAAGAGGRCEWSTPVPAAAGHSCRAFQDIGTGGIADPAPGGQLEFAHGRGGLGSGRLSAGPRPQTAAALVGQAQRAEGSLADAGEDPAWRGTAGRLAGYPDRPAAVPAQDPQDQLPGDPVGHHRPAPADLA